MSEEPYVRLLAEYTDDVRHPLIVDCEDWDMKIRPALEELSSLFPLPTIAGWLSMMRVAIEVIYVMGYERGKREALMPTFVVAED